MIAPTLCLLLIGPPGSPSPPEPSGPAPRPALAASGVRADETDQVARVGLGLVLVGRGRTREALATWTELIADERVAEPLRQRARIELERTHRWIDARAAFFERVIARDKKLVFEWQGERLVSALAAFDGRELVFAKNRRGIERLDVEALPPLELAAWMGDDKYGDPTGWIRHWPGAIAGDERSLRLVGKAADPDAAGVARDAETVWPELRAAGEAALGLYDLGRFEPTTPDEDARWLAALEELFASHGEHALVRERRAALRGLAAPVIDRLAESLDVDRLFAARASELEAGRYSLRYEFDDPRELADFTAADEIPPYYARFVPLQLESTPLVIEDGALHGRGRHLLTHVVPFEAPLSVRWTIEYRSGELDDPEGVILAVFACHDGWQQYAMNVNLGDLEVRDGARFEVDKLPDEERFLPYDRPHPVALIHTGDAVRVEVAGKTRAEVVGTAPARGAITLYLHSDMELWLHDLEIEGGLSPRALAPRRSAWAEARRAALR